MGDGARSTIPVGSHIKGKVKSITDFGIFVGVDGGHRRPGAHLRSALDEEGQAPLRALQEGRRGRGGRARHRRRQRAHLARRQAAHATIPGARCRERYPVGGRVHGTVTSVTDFGVFVEIEEGIEGLIHVSQLSTERVDKPRELFKRRRRGRGRGHQRRPARAPDRLSASRRSRRSEERDEVDTYLRREREGSTLLVRGHPERGAAPRPRRGRSTRRRPTERRSRWHDRHPMARGHPIVRVLSALGFVLVVRRSPRSRYLGERGQLGDVLARTARRRRRRCEGVIEDATTSSRRSIGFAKNAGVARGRAAHRVAGRRRGALAGDLRRGPARCARRKPVVASLGGVAASGGYYIASACDTIVANPGTLTGSIGVIMELGNVEGLLQKLGVQPECHQGGQVQGHRARRCAR